MIVKARLNWGRWIAECPKQHTPLDSVTLEVVPGKDTTFICPSCYPKSIASHAGMVSGRFQIVPDISARRTAKYMAEQAGEIYDIEYPADIAQILEAVQSRAQQNQNWEHGETLEQLAQENVDNGI